MKFSIIIPVYQSEAYIKRCLTSLKEQTYSDYEAIVVNDGSTDKSEAYILEMIKKDPRFRYFKKENGGLSDARNYGVQRADGDYLLFLDSDDAFDPNLLQTLQKVIKQEPDLEIIRFQLRLFENGATKEIAGTPFSKTDGFKALQYLVKETFFETAWTYAYQTSFFQENKFVFEKGKTHEDFGLIPYVIAKASFVMAIDEYGYHYYKHDNSITTTKAYEKQKKRVYDVFDLFMIMSEKIKADQTLIEATKTYLLSYYANAVLSKGKLLNSQDLKVFIKKIKEQKIGEYLLEDSLLQKMKKQVIHFFPKFYIKHDRH